MADTPNVDLLRRTLAHIETHPELWDQTRWRTETENCGTAYCFAGWAATLDGGQWYSDDPGSACGDDLLAVDEDGEYVMALKDGTLVTDIQARAERILGLTESQAEMLFYSLNTLDDLRGIVAELCEGSD